MKRTLKSVGIDPGKVQEVCSRAEELLRLMKNKMGKGMSVGGVAIAAQLALE